MNSEPVGLFISTQEGVALLGVNKATIKRWIDAGKIQAERVKGNGGEQYRILLSSLPQEAQSTWHYQQAMKKAERLGAPRERTERFNAEAWDRFDRAPAGFKREAERRVEILMTFQAMQGKGLSNSAIAATLQREHDVSKRTLERWRNLVKGQDQRTWAPLLMPDWKPGKVRAGFTEEAWESIKADWGRLSQPCVASCYRRAQKEAKARGWVLPSLDTVERRIHALPSWWKVATRQGWDAVHDLYPAQRRDYTTLRVNELWCADGRKADVWCRWSDGEVSRPIVLGWIDVRTRVFLGFEIGKSETSDLIRLAFKRAAEDYQAIPAEALLDNGRGFASKLMTGGQATRFRFKVKEEDVPGILTLMGVKVVWATPGRGQVKPIEAFWRTLAQADRRAEFQGAYCGNSPDDKPDDADKKNAVPIATYRRIMAEEINAYNVRGHRGQGMDGQAPLELYAQLLEHTPVTQPTKAQMRLCLLAAQAVKPDRKDHGIWLLGNKYWNEQCIELRTDRAYTVRFNPEDASDPVAVYDGDKFLFEVEPHSLTGFRDQEAAKDHNRARNRYKKAKKEELKALRDMQRAEGRPLPKGGDVDTETGEIRNPTRPLPRVPRLLHLDVDKPANDPGRRAAEDDEGIGSVNEILKKLADRS